MKDVSDNEEEVRTLSDPPYMGETHGHAGQVRGTCWCWTINNYTEEEVQSINMLVLEDNHVSYVCYGKEVGENGTPHLQGFLKTRQTVALTALKKKLPRAHFEKMKAKDVNEAINYCHKKGTKWQEPEHELYEFGVRPKGAGHRTDIDDLHERLKEGATHQSISNEYFGLSLRYSRGIQTWLSLNERTPVRSEPKIFWLWGPTGSGKSYRILKLLEPIWDQVYFLTETTSGTWWDKYQGQEIVWMDDLRGAWMKMHMMLRILQSGPCQVSARGVGHWLKASTFYITTNDPPHLTYDEGDKLMRRVMDYAFVVQITSAGVKCLSRPIRHPDATLWLDNEV